MNHFNTFVTARVLKDEEDAIYKYKIWPVVLDYIADNPHILKSIDQRITKKRVGNKDVNVITNLMLFAGTFEEYVTLVKSFYEELGYLDDFTPGSDGYEIRESAIALAPVGEESKLIEPIAVPKVRTQLASPNFVTHVADDFPDVDINLSNNSFTMPLNEAVKMAKQILHIADFHDKDIQKSENKSSASARHA
ncbi:MAG: hypothetical protein MK006_02070 [Pirellulales bacterium]|nr:hypothetical protein [Pirellulales bacterium]